MNKISADKIKSATAFLIWFRYHLPRHSQEQVRPHLERPIQMALKILDGCDAKHPLGVKEIAERAGVSPDTARQVLLALKDGGMPFAASPNRGWQSMQEISAPESALTYHNPSMEDTNPNAPLVATQG